MPTDINIGGLKICTLGGLDVALPDPEHARTAIERGEVDDDYLNSAREPYRWVNLVI